MRNLKVDVSWIIFPLCIIWPFCWEALRISVSLLGKESACSAGDPGLTPGLGRSAGKRIGYLLQGFPGGSEVKASACNAGDLGLIPGSGRSPGEGNGNPFQYSCLEKPMDGGAWWATVHGVSRGRTRLHFHFHLLQYSWASLVAQLVKNLPAVQETWVQSLGWKDPWRRESLPTTVFWPAEFHGLCSPWGHKESDTTEQLSLWNLIDFLDYFLELIFLG